MKTRQKLWWLPIILFATQSIAAQTSETPEQFVSRYLEMSKTDWLGTAKLMHPEALVRFKALFSPLFEVKPPTVGSQIFGVKSVSAYEALGTDVVYTKFIDYLYRTSPGFAETMAQSELRVVGAVTEGELVHVLYRTKIRVADVSVDKIEIITVKKNGSGWGAMLTGDYEGLIESIVKGPVAPPPAPKRKRN